MVSIVLLLSALIGSAVTTNQIVTIQERVPDERLPPPLVFQNTIVQASQVGIRAYSTRDGRLLWVHLLERYIPSALRKSNRCILVAESQIYCLDSASGVKVWTYMLSGNASLGLFTVSDHYLYVGTDTHIIAKVDGRNGRETWIRDIDPGWSFREIVRGVTIHGGVLYVSVEKWLDSKGNNTVGRVLAMDSATGTTKWIYTTSSERDIGNRSGMSSPPLFDDGRIIVGDELGNAIRSLSSRSGRLRWKYIGTQGYAGVPSQPIRYGKRLYAGSGDMKIFALDVKQGNFIWARSIQASVVDFIRCGEYILVNTSGTAMAIPLRDQEGSGAAGNYDVISQHMNSAFTYDRITDRVVAADAQGYLIIKCNTKWR